MIEKKRIVFVFTHLKISNGVARTVINLANCLNPEKYEITLVPLFSVEEKMLQLVNSSIKVQKVFGFYFRGFAKLLEIIPPSLLYKIIIRDDYDIEVSYQFGLPTKTLSYSTNKHARHICWMHGYDYKMKQLKYYNKYDTVVCVSKDGSDRLSKIIKNT